MSKINYYDRVRLRSMIGLNPTDEPELFIQVVPAHEADAAAGRISADAPVGRAVLHKRVGDTVDVRAQGRVITMKIVELEKHQVMA